MDHIVYLNRKVKELANLINGSKTMTIRGAIGCKLPYGFVKRGDVLCFAENSKSGSLTWMFGCRWRILILSAHNKP